jgi:hypothetical protein
MSTESSVSSETSVLNASLISSVSTESTLTGPEIAALVIGLVIFVIITGIFLGCFIQMKKMI